MASHFVQIPSVPAVSVGHCRQAVRAVFGSVPLAHCSHVPALFSARPGPHATQAVPVPFGTSPALHDEQLPATVSAWSVPHATHAVQFDRSPAAQHADAARQLSRTKSGLCAEAVTVAGERFLAAMRRDDTTREDFASLAQRWIAGFGNESEAARLLRALAGDHRHPGMVEAATRVNDDFVDFWCGWLRQREDGRGKGSDTPTRVRGTLIVAALTGLVATKQDRGDMVVALLDELARLIGTSDEGGAD